MSEPRRIDVTLVKPGQLKRMRKAKAVPSPELRAAIERAAERRRGATP